MLAYIVRRLLLIIPTLFGIMVVNFFIIQAAPGGPVEQLIAQIEGTAVGRDRARQRRLRRRAGSRRRARRAASDGRPATAARRGFDPSSSRSSSSCTASTSRRTSASSR